MHSGVGNAEKMWGKKQKKEKACRTNYRKEDRMELKVYGDLNEMNASAEK